MQKLKAAFRTETRYLPFLLSILMMGLSYGLYKGVIDNFLAEVVGMNEFDKGLSEFFRELPGLLLVFVLAVFYMCSAERLYKIGAVIMLIGMAFHAILPPTKILLTLSILIYSMGEHIQLGMKSTITLGYAKDGKSGEALGYQSAISQIGTLIGFLLITAVFLCSGENQPFRIIFAASAALIAGGMVISFGITGKSETDRAKSRFYFRKKFTKYYMLEVFYGARKQVFFTFGPYVLILFYGADTAVISALYAISAVACFLLSPVVGRIIDKAGYKIVMVMDTIILVGVCFFYGFAHYLFPQNIAFIVCCANYVLDSVISLASMASNVYVQAISDSPEETRATISTGISVNHMITILIALFGGWIWQKLGMETLFVISAILGLCNSAYAATIHVKKKETA